MPTFIAISLPMNFFIRPPFNLWIQAHLCCLSHRYYQHLLLTLPHLSTTPISTVTRVVLMATDVPTTTTITTKTSLTTMASIPLLLPTGDRATSSRTDAPLGLDNGLLTGFLSRMSSVNCQLCFTFGHIAPHCAQLQGSG